MAIRKHKSKTGSVTYFVYLKDRNENHIYVGKARTKEDALALERQEKDKQWKLRNGLAIPESKKTFEDLAVPWVEERLKTHRRGKDDKWRLNKHLLPHIGGLTLGQITVSKLKDLLKQLREKGTGKTTMRACIRLLGRFLTERVEEGLIAFNPVSRLDRHTRRLFKPDHDPRKTPFLRTKADIRKVYLAIPDEEMRTIFAVGALAGLRTGEILGLRIEDVDLDGRRILVQRSYGVTPKDEEPRLVPINDTLKPLLERWLLARDERRGLLFPPSGHGEFIKAHRLRDALEEALKEVHMGPLTWYQATRHTFASHWVMDGRKIEKLRDIMGHSSVTVTERYAHLAPGAFTAEDLAAVSVDLSDPKVLRLPVPPPADSDTSGTMAAQREGGAPKARSN